MYIFYHTEEIHSEYYALYVILSVAERSRRICREQRDSH